MKKTILTFALITFFMLMFFAINVNAVDFTPQGDIKQNLHSEMRFSG